MIYRTPKLFASTNLFDENRIKESHQRLPNTQVIAASIKDQILTNLDDTVQLRFRLQRVSISLDLDNYNWRHLYLFIYLCIYLLFIY